MAIDYRMPPSIESYAPLGINVPLDAVIEVRFSSDLDRTALAGSVSVIDPQGQPVPGVLSYENKTLRFTPNQPLRPATTYTVVLHGLPSAGTKGVIRTVVGVPLGENITFTFQTAEAQVELGVELLHPADGVEVSEVEFRWKPVENAAEYHIQVYEDPSLKSLVWETKTTETSARPIDFLQGQYWWRVAAVGPNSVPGPWSPVYTFLYIAGYPVIPEPPVPPPEPSFHFNGKTITSPLTYLEIKWPEAVEIEEVQVIREDVEEVEHEVPATFEWIDTALRITPTEG